MEITGYKIPLLSRLTRVQQRQMTLQPEQSSAHKPVSP